MGSPFQLLFSLCKSSVQTQHTVWPGLQNYLNCGGLSFPETLEEWVVVDYQSGEEFTGFQCLRYFNLWTDSGS